MQSTIAASPTFSMQRPAPDQSIEMSLREHLLAAQTGHTPSAASIPGPHDSIHATHSTSTHENQIDPAIAGPPFSMMSAGDLSAEEHAHTLPGETRKGRRELSTSKRAAQNRAAQRAFRQRKEEYIKTLKDQVKDYEAMAERYKSMQTENYQLRDYIITLQSRLLESQGAYPQPPSDIDLSNPRDRPNVDPGMQQVQAATAQMGQTAAQAAAAAAQAAAAQANALNSASGSAAFHKGDGDTGGNIDLSPVRRAVYGSSPLAST